MLFHEKVISGLHSGFKQRQKSFLALLIMSLATLPAMLLATSIAIDKPLDWTFLVSCGPTLWVGAGFFLYLTVIACLQQYHRSREDISAFVALGKQVDKVVFAIFVAMVFLQVTGN